MTFLFTRLPAPWIVSLFNTHLLTSLLMQPQITHIITGLKLGGAERALYTLLTNGLEGPFRNHVISLIGPGYYGSKLEQAGIPVTCLQMRPGQPSLSALWSLRSAIRAHPPQIVQGWMPHGNIAATISQVFTGNPSSLAWNIRMTIEGEQHLPRLTRFITRLVAMRIAHPDVAIYNSFRGREQHEALGYPRRIGCVIPNGFDTDIWFQDTKIRSAIRANLSIDDKIFVIGFVGRAHPQKDLPNLYQAFSQVVSSCPDVVLVAAGQDLNRYGPHHERIKFLGQCDNVPSLMKAFDLFCLPAGTEGFPNVLGEAMATGVPCVTTDVGDASMIVGETGWIVPPRNSKALARALIEAIRTPPEALRARGAIARDRIQTEFSISSVVTKYIDLYDRVIKNYC
ncbi:glycosyltransferase [Cyanobium sp. Alchichica 3B3-8F6]|uniref:glycosyltransferase n=1 Tax=Cyanobium sp. Alchichica 3B3-8F6 TaxID=2823696 RepID=UPI0020CDC481|nr:glycosyltransferase [Cyanobium sp. Alchichica 3B3-8F6]MCP9883371.1 glycosyltransferase [Cyanobium sp. Alchichica 3B3-8F6]